MKIGYVGLGKMGKNMVLHLLEQGVEVVAWNRSPEPREEVAKAGATAVIRSSSITLKCTLNYRGFSVSLILAERDLPLIAESVAVRGD